MSDNTTTSLNTAFLYVQEKKLRYLFSNAAILLNMFPMKAGDKIGRQKNIPIALTMELGFTFGDGTAFTLNSAIAAVYDELEINPSPVTLRTRVSLSAANKWKEGGDVSVINNVAIRSGQMKKSIEKMAEVCMLHGRTGIATVSALNDSSGTNELTITDATWSSGLWAAWTGILLDAYTSTTKKNSNTYLTVSVIDHDNKKVTVTGNATDTAAIDVGSVLYPYGAYGNDQYGLKYQLDTSGTVFGIDNSAYPMFKACEYAVGGDLTMTHILKGQAKAVNRGGLDEDVILLVSPDNFENLNDDLAALREFDGSYKSEKGENGFSKISYKGQAGMIEVVSHPYMMDGDAMSFPKSCIRRIGASDIDWMKDEQGGAWRSLDVAGVAGYQATCYYEFNIVVVEPAKCVLYSGITL